jgi:hypothetical protein
MKSDNDKAPTRSRPNVKRFDLTPMAFPVLGPSGALKKIPQRLLEAFRYFLLLEAEFDVKAAALCHISLNSS